MVAAGAATPAATARPRKPKNAEDPPNPSRPPLIPSEKDNAAVSRRPRAKEVTSRYLSAYTSSCSSSTSTSSSSRATTATTASSSSSSSSSTPSRRFASPLLTPRPSTPRSTAPRRSQSVDRTRPATPRPDHTASGNVASATEISAASRALCTTRSLLVSFQGESFFFQTSKAKPETPNSTRKPTPDRRTTTTATTPMRSTGINGGGNGGAHHQTENSRAGDYHLWPAARVKKPNPLARSLDYSLDKKESPFGSVRLMQYLRMLDEERQASLDSGDLSASSDAESDSSGSNSGAQESSVPARNHVMTPRGISVASRFWQETNSRLRRLPEPGLPLSTPLPRASATPKLVPVKKPLVDNSTLSPTTALFPLRGPIRPSSPGKVVTTPLRSAASPLRTRSNSTLAGSVITGQPANAPSIISFAAEVRRSKKGENKIEEAHLLRLLHNRLLQWRYVNARVTSSLLMQRVNAEKNIYNAWVTTTEMRDSVTIKKIKLHLLRQKMKLTLVLKEQMTSLEEWSLMDREHSSSLSGSIEALKASTLRLPVVGGTRANIQDVKDAVGSVIDAMQAIGSSICSMMLKVEEMSSLVSELTKLSAQERALLDQSRDLLCAVAAMHVKQCSLHTHLLQLRHMAS